jgi:hypothetical protein
MTRFVLPSYRGARFFAKLKINALQECYRNPLAQYCNVICVLFPDKVFTHKHFLPYRIAFTWVAPPPNRPRFGICRWCTSYTRRICIKMGRRSCRQVARGGGTRLGTRKGLAMYEYNGSQYVNGLKSPLHITARQLFWMLCVIYLGSLSYISLIIYCFIYKFNKFIPFPYNKIKDSPCF